MAIIETEVGNLGDGEQQPETGMEPGAGLGGEPARVLKDVLIPLGKLAMGCEATCPADEVTAGFTPEIMVTALKYADPETMAAVVDRLFVMRLRQTGPREAHKDQVLTTLNRIMGRVEPTGEEQEAPSGIGLLWRTYRESEQRRRATKTTPRLPPGSLS